MSGNWQLPRRTFLRGLGTTIALPMLDAMLPSATSFAAAGKAGTEQAAAVRRMAFLYVPNGANMAEWTPKAEGTDYELTPTLKPLESVKSDVVVMSGLAQTKSRANGDGPGDHARAQATFLTGCQAKKTAGADIRVGVSVDQLAAQQIGDRTRFPSLELGCESGSRSGNCDSGYSCAYSSNMSWRTSTTPVPKEVDPRLVFERLFGNGKPGDTAISRDKRDAYKKSILDFALEDARDLRQRLGIRDQQKLDEYLYALREVETRIAKAEAATEATAKQVAAGVAKPMGIPKEYDQHLRLMTDLLVLAFRADLTRIATYMLANDGSNRSYALINVRDGHHDLSHHGGNKEKLTKIAQINAFHVGQLAYLLAKLKETKEGDRSLLDNSMIVYGSGIGDGNRHNHDDLPVIFAGKGGGTIETGRHVRYRFETPMTNLFLSMLDRMGVKAESLGDSTGRLLPAVG